MSVNSVIGLDVGTYNAISARLNKDELEFKKEVNAFFTLPIENAFMVNMLKQAGAPIIEVKNSVYILGENAIDLALSMGQEYQRPMRNGILSINEKDAFNILSVILKSMIGEIEENDTIVYYSVPADSINTETHADYHQKILQSMFDKYNVNNKKIRAFPLNEALAVIYSELQNNKLTGIGLSFGAGMVNICYSIFGVPIFKFSITNSGDWIDEESAKHCGETISYINHEKTKIDLSLEPSTAIERAIIYHYELMIENSIKFIKKGIIEAGTKAKTDKPIPIVLAGGTASPKGFVEFFEKVLKKEEFPLPIGEIKLAKNHLYSVAKGCYAAATMHK